MFTRPGFSIIGCKTNSEVSQKPWHSTVPAIWPRLQVLWLWLLDAEVTHGVLGKLFLLASMMGLSKGMGPRHLTRQKLSDFKHRISSRSQGSHSPIPQNPKCKSSIQLWIMVSGCWTEKTCGLQQKWKWTGVQLEFPDWWGCYLSQVDYYIYNI